MTDFHRRNPYRLPQVFLLILLTMGGLCILWEFKLEAWVMALFDLPYDSDFENSERWRFVLTSMAFSLLSLIVPALWLKRLASNTRSSFRRMQRTQTHTEDLAKHDSLTGLFNRRAFMEFLREQFIELQPAVVILIDLDHFKAINDQHGHSAGDVVLMEIANRLDRIATEYGGIAVRLGGDEFCLLFKVAKEENELHQIAKATLYNLCKPILNTLEPTQLGATLGISRSWLDAQDASTLLHHADTAMYRGKSSGRSTYHFYDVEYERQRQAQFDLDFALKKAIEHEEIVPFYQPIVALPSQDIVGFEILARWVRPDESTGMPADFIPVLERLGLIPAMTRSLVKQACRAAHGWDDHLHLSLNVSAAMITDELFPDRLLEQLRHENFPFTRFEVEITEEALVGNLEAAQRNLSRLHAHGITSGTG